MEHLPEETAAIGTETSAEIRKKDCSSTINPDKPADCGLVASPALPVSTSREWPGSSTLSNLDSLKDNTLNRGEKSLDESSLLTTPYPINDEGIMIKELTVINSDSPYSYNVGCSSTEEVTNHNERKWMFQDKDLSSLSLREDLRRIPLTFQDAKHSSSKQKNVDSSRISSQVTDSDSNIISSNRQPPGGIRSKILSSSSFSQFFLGQYAKTTAKGVPCKTLEASAEFRTPPPVSQNKKKPGSSSEAATDTLTNRNSLWSQLHSHDIASERLDLLQSGINLRDWLDSRSPNPSEVNIMHLFRKIVQVVDIAHSQGIALLELQPSSFILYSTGYVKYIGSFMEIDLLTVENQENTKKRDLDQGLSDHNKFAVKKRNLGKSESKSTETHFTTKFSEEKAADHICTSIFDMQNCYHSECKIQNFSIYEGMSIGKCRLASDSTKLEKEWYSSPGGLDIRDLLSFNIYCLGIMLFEFLCHFESIEAHSEAIMDLRDLILPPNFLSESPKEAEFCFWLLQTEPSSRPTTREILQSELIYGSEDMSIRDDAPSCADKVDDAESDLLLHFLFSLKEFKRNKVSKLLEDIEFLEVDIKEIERRHASRKSSDIIGGIYDTGQEHNLKDHRSTEVPYYSFSRTNDLRDKLLKNINKLEDAYFFMRSHLQLTEVPGMDRSDKDMLQNRDRCSWVQTQQSLPTTEEKSVDHVGIFFDGICKFARYIKFDVCGKLRNSDILNSNNVICSLSFDREEEYIAVAGVSKKIKIFEFGSLLSDFVDVQYPVLEMSNNSKFSCVCWNNYIKNYLASTDYDGLVQMWDARTGQGIARYEEHQKRAWSVDFSQLDPTKFASGSDDGSIRIWSINERNSTGTIRNPANVCCVQFSAFSSHLLAYGSADYRIYCYDLRHTRIPWCTLAGHGNAVSYVRFLDSETLVSASTDNTLKFWDLKKTSLEGLSLNACSLTSSGHTNLKNFVGLAVLNGYIACGSETNEVYAYYRSLPMPITSHKFGCVEPISGYENIDDNGHFVSSVCWRRKSEMVVAANSNGGIEILRMV